MTKDRYCPFCGDLNIEYDGALAIKCLSCGAKGPDFNTNFEAALLDWNKRVDDDLFQIIKELATALKTEPDYDQMIAEITRLSQSAEECQKLKGELFLLKEASH